MKQIRIIHFMNQFFAGIGGEEKADVPVDSREGSLGPGKRLQVLLGDSAEIVVTAYCGDNYFPEHHDEVLGKILQIARDHDIRIVVAGPAFFNGRYGFACAEVCHFLSTSSGLDCVTGMYVENPGVVVYRQYKDRRVFMLPTAEGIAGMEDALSRMAQFVLKLAAGSAIGSATEEGYISRGLRVVGVASESGVKRATNMLLNKLADRPFTTEIPVESEEVIPVPPRIAKIKDACLALATTSGVVAQGNPDGFKSLRNTQWSKYSIDKLDAMKDARWEVIHSGYNNTWMNDNPNYGVPLDVCRELERGGVFGKLYPYYYASTGVAGETSVMQRIGKEIASDMKAEGLDAVLLVSTWGSDTHSGAVIAKEIEKEGIPVAHITAISMLSKHMGANRIVMGNKIPYPCGEPHLPAESDRALRREIVKCALGALQSDVHGPTIFVPNVVYTHG